jgi:23S rRNA pseudouridine1911/1915/1917 synthase
MTGDKILKFIVGEEFANCRIDKFLAEELHKTRPEITRTKIQNFIGEDLVLDEQNRPISSPSHKIKFGQKIYLKLPEIKESHLAAKEISFEIVFEDDDLLVINKPPGLTVHPGAGNHQDTLVNGLLFTHGGKLSNVSGDLRPGIVHRLDKDTSGLMLVAKNDLTHQILAQKLQEREIKRTYLAFIYGAMPKSFGSIRKNIVRSRVNRLKMNVARLAGRSAITHFETKKVFCGGFVSLVECRLETGRTHQIRVHFESEKHSLIGDQTYNSSRKNAPKGLDKKIENFVQNFPRQALHSYQISFIHPRTEQEMSFEIPLPDDLKELQQALESESE